MLYWSTMVDRIPQLDGTRNIAWLNGTNLQLTDASGTLILQAATNVLSINATFAR